LRADGQFSRTLGILDLLQQVLGEDHAILPEPVAEQPVVGQRKELGTGAYGNPLRAGRQVQAQEDVLQALEVGVAVFFVGDLELAHQGDVSAGTLGGFFQHMPAFGAGQDDRPPLHRQQQTVALDDGVVDSRQPGDIAAVQL